MTRRIATGETARLVATIGPDVEVRWADPGDHWPGYDPRLTLRRGYWVGDDRSHGWVGTRKGDVKDEALDRRRYDAETGEPDVRWIATIREEARTGDPWELAVWAGESWELVGDFPTRDAAIEAAKHVHAKGAGDVFGISGDPASGHYETCVTFDEDGEPIVS